MQDEMAKDDPLTTARNGVRHEVRSAPSDFPEDTTRPSLEALAFMANIPPKYWHLLNHLPAVEAARLEQEQKREREAAFWENALEVMAQQQRQIDENRLRLTIDGADVEISQGDLRKAMTARLDELREQRRAVQRSGRGAGDAQRLDRLIEQYEPLIDRLQKEKADTATLAEIQELAKKDPPLCGQIQMFSNERVAVVAISEQQRRVSYATANLDQGGISAFKLREPFARSASPEGLALATAPAVTRPAVENQQQDQRTPFATAGF